MNGTPCWCAGNRNRHEQAIVRVTTAKTSTEPPQSALPSQFIQETGERALGCSGAVYIPGAASNELSHPRLLAPVEPVAVSLGTCVDLKSVAAVVELVHLAAACRLRTSFG